MTEVAEDTVIKVAAGQERLNMQQQQLHSNYEDVQRSISFSLKGNVKALHHERMLIDSGRRQLKEMAKAVKEKLGLWCDSTWCISKNSANWATSQEKSLGPRREPTNSTNIWHQARIEPRPHWWEASTLTTVPSFLPYNYWFLRHNSATEV